MIALRLNMVVSAPAKSKSRAPRVYVICHIDWTYNRLALAEQLPEKTSNHQCRYHRKPRAMRIEDLQEKLDRGDWVVSDEPLNKQLLHPRAITKKMTAIRDQRWELINKIIGNHSLLRDYLYNKSIGSFVHTLCDQQNCSHKFFYDTLHRCLSLGGTREACLPKYGTHISTPPSNMQKPGKKRGRKPKFAVIVYRNWTNEDSTALQTFFNRLKNIHRKTLYEIYVEFCFVILKVVIDIVGHRRITMIGECPTGIISIEQFRYHWKKEIPFLKWLRRRRGKVNFDNNCRGVPGSARFWVRGPTVRYEIDATLADIYLRYALSEEERLSIGRPHVFIVIDVFSTMIVGLYVTLLDEEWTAAAQALFNAFTDKVEFCRQFGVEITIEEWNCYHPCEQLTFDRGSLYSNNHVESVLRSETGVERANVAPAFTGSAKGICERALGYLMGVTKTMPGAVDKNRRRDLQHASNKALFTYHQYVRALILAILDHNKYKRCVSLLDENMAKHEIKATPIDVWDYALKTYIGERHPIPIDTLRFALLPQADAVITAQGVRFKSTLFENPDCIDYFSLARTQGRTTIKIRYSKVIPNPIFWRAPDHKIYALELTWNSRRMRGASYADLVVRERIEAYEVAHNDAHALAAHIERYKNMRELEASARRECADMDPSFRKSAQPGVHGRKQQAAAAECEALRASVLHELGIDQNNLSPQMRAAFTEDHDALLDTLFERMYGTHNTHSGNDKFSEDGE